MTSEQVVSAFVYLLSINYYYIPQARILCMQFLIFMSRENIPFLTMKMMNLTVIYNDAVELIIFD
jgi:hypothetical protein